MRVRFQRFDRLEASPYRIKMNVIHNTQERLTLFNKQGLISTLKHVTPFMNESIEAIGECALEPLHARDQIRVHGL